MSMIQVNWNPDRNQLKGFGLISVVAFAAIGAWIWFRHSIFSIDLHPMTAARTAYLLWGVALLCLVLRAAAPVALRPLYLLLTAISLPIGFVLSHVLMALIFYGLFTPVGLFFRLIGRDALHRQIEPTAATYWVRRVPITDVKRYFRQF
ncbi:MAG: hypothetical protein L6Q92_08585 [Phycisphaerae bacterium]|nr:hypothetical protein [Phycisphaerae bacterium]